MTKLFKNDTLRGLIFFAITSSTLIACSKDPEVSPAGIKIDFLTSVTLPSILKEASGIEIDDNGTFWSINDRGNEAVLVEVRPDGTDAKQLTFSTAMNIDWEDLAYENGTMYIGDFGNNDNFREDLKIYKIANFSNLGNDGIPTDSINFSFEDQVEFPPLENNLHFDVEGFFVSGSKVYLFTKDRSDPFQGITKLYTLETETGTQIAKLVSTFSTSSAKREGAITAADLSPDGTKVVLISEEQIYLFSNFTAPNYFAGTMERFAFEEKRQYEGVVFINDCELAVVNEDNYGVDGLLMKINICI